MPALGVVGTLLAVLIYRKKAIYARLVGVNSYVFDS